MNPVIVAENRRWRGASRKLVGRRLRDVKDGLAREVVDVLVEVEFARRPYRGRGGRERAVYRVVGVRHDDHREHHWYVTNVPVTVLFAGRDRDHSTPRAGRSSSSSANSRPTSGSPSSPPLAASSSRRSSTPP